MSAKETGYKWSKFVWDDWRNDASLQSCDLSTKGLWMDLLSLMFSSERQGYLQVNNQPMSLLYLSKKTGVDKRTIEKKLKVLIKNNVCSLDENGIVFSRRMVRETRKSTASLQEGSRKDTVSLQEGSRKVPVNLQEEIAENSQKQDPLNKNRIDKNRIDKKKEKSNKKESENLVGDQGDVSPNGSTQNIKSKHGSRLPDDWSPDEQGREYARNLGLDVGRTIEDFCDYWHAKTGKDATKMDWSLTWKTWCRKAKDYMNVHHFPKQNQHQSTKTQHNILWQIEEDNQLWGNG